MLVRLPNVGKRVTCRAEFCLLANQKIWTQLSKRGCLVPKSDAVSNVSSLGKFNMTVTQFFADQKRAEAYRTADDAAE